jgi:hypothetical protein
VYTGHAIRRQRIANVSKGGLFLALNGGFCATMRESVYMLLSGLFPTTTSMLSLYNVNKTYVIENFIMFGNGRFNLIISEPS